MGHIPAIGRGCGAKFENNINFAPAFKKTAPPGKSARGKSTRKVRKRGNHPEGPQKGESTRKCRIKRRKPARQEIGAQTVSVLHLSYQGYRLMYRVSVNQQ